MTDREKCNLSDSLHDFFKMADEVIHGKGQTIEYHKGKIDQAENISSPETCDEVDEDEDPYIEFSKMKENPNEGMVIVQMDNGGPRMKRTRPTEIVIPLDHVSSSESIALAADESGNSTSSCKTSSCSSSSDERSSMQFDDSNSEEYNTADETNDDYSCPTNPTKACKLDLSSTSSCCSIPSEKESEFYNSDCGRSEPSCAKSIGDPLDPEVCSEKLRSNCAEANEKFSETEEGHTDEEDSAEKEERKSSSRSDSSYSGSERSCSDDVSETSLLNLYQKLKNGISKLEEMPEAIDQQGGHILCTRPLHAKSKFMALRMYSSLSANYKFRNVGYVDMNSQIVRPNSTTLESFISRITPAVGDTFEIHRGNVTSISVDETSPDNDNSSPVCSTRFDFTPAARSKIEGALTQCSDAVNGARSAESGRNNPQAKQDNEVRSCHKKELPIVNLQCRRQNKVLPPISKATEADKGESNKKLLEKKDKPAPTRMKPFVTQQSAVKQNIAVCHTRKQCSDTKPGIPHQLRSVACYQDGNVEVSIMGDKRLVSDSEPLNVNITFVHRQDPAPNRKVKVIDIADDKKEPTFQNRRVPNIKNTDTNQTPKTVKTSLPPLKNPPGSSKNSCGQLRNITTVLKKDILSSTNRINKKTLPPLRNIPEKIKKSIQTTKEKQISSSKKKEKKKIGRKVDQLNWDIVNERAQWPPFNTHINQEASERHQKLFADIPV